MPRYVWPQLFMLYGGGLNLSSRKRSPAFLQAAIKESLAALFRVSPPSARELMHPDGVPVALRWCTRPDLGFPRQPFKVYRRVRGQEQFTPLAGITPSTPFNVNGDAIIDWGLTEMYEVMVQAAPASGNQLRVEGLGQNFEVIPGQRLVFNSTGTGVLRAPGTSALRITGQGAISALSGVDSFQFANRSDWQLIEVVGLPYDKGEVNLPVYSPETQGISPASLPGVEAALMRLQIARLMHQPLPVTGIADIPTPAWPSPDPIQYLNSLRQPPALAPLPLITECLGNSNDSDPAHMQVSYVHSAKLPGIRQADMPGTAPGPDPAKTDLPVVGAMMLSAGSDSFAAAGLGYGTTDFPPPAPAPPPVFTHVVIPPVTSGFDTAFDYMVTNVFVFPFIGPIELAALVQARPLPEAPVFVFVATDHLNRAPHTDDPETEAVRVSWNLASLPQGYGIVASHKSGESTALNSPRRSGVDGYNLYIPARPATGTLDGAPPPDIITTFVEQTSPVPFSGSLASRYLVIGCDVFGRWSNWRLGNHSVSAPPVTKPAVH